MSEEKDIVERLKAAFDDDHGNDCAGRTYICSCDFDENIMVAVEDAASEITRLRGEVEGWKNTAKRKDDEIAALKLDLADPWLDEHGTTWNRPTSHAYMMSCRALHKHEAEAERLRGEVERLREGFRRINRRSSPDATRTFDGAILALDWITAEARGNLQGE